jgi:hypothetical protein
VNGAGAREHRLLVNERRNLTVALVLAFLTALVFALMAMTSSRGAVQHVDERYLASRRLRSLPAPLGLVTPLPRASRRLSADPPRPVPALFAHNVSVIAAEGCVRGRVKAT